MLGIHVRLLVSDFPSCFRFYSEALGLKVNWGDEADNYASFEARDGAVFSIFNKRLMAEAVGRRDYPAQTQCQDPFVLTFRVADLDEVAGRLRRMGIALVNAPTDRPEWGIRVAHFRDPDGNLIELNAELPKEQWTAGLTTAAEKYGW